MGHVALDQAIQEMPQLRAQLAAAEADLTRILALLAPYSARAAPPESDLVFQIRILEQAVAEIRHMLDRRA